jgi:hypothetical protein
VCYLDGQTDMDDSERTAAQHLLADGVATAVGLQGDMPLRWVSVIETIDREGKRCMWQFGSEGITVWDALSLLDYAITKERATLMRRELGYPDK